MQTELSPSAETILATQDLVCRLADAQLNAVWSEAVGEWDLDNPLRSKDQRKADYLALLRMNRLVNVAIEMNILRATSRANAT